MVVDAGAVLGDVPFVVVFVLFVSTLVVTGGVGPSPRPRLGVMGVWMSVGTVPFSAVKVERFTSIPFNITVSKPILCRAPLISPLISNASL